MPRCPCPVQALYNILAAKLCEKKKTMAKGRGAKDSARGIARADWLRFSSEKQKQKKREIERRRRFIHPHSGAGARPATTTTTNSHTRTHTHTHTLTLTHNPQRKNPNLHHYHLALLTHPKSTTLRLPFLTFIFPCFLALSIQEAQNFV